MIDIFEKTAEIKYILYLVDNIKHLKKCSYSLFNDRDFKLISLVEDESLIEFKIYINSEIEKIKKRLSNNNLKNDSIEMDNLAKDINELINYYNTMCKK